MSRRLRAVVVCLMLAWCLSRTPVWAQDPGLHYNWSESEGDGYPFITTNLQDPHLKELRSKYRLNAVVSSSATDLEKCLIATSWVHSRIKHSTHKERILTDPLQILEAASRGEAFDCHEYSWALIGCLNALGVDARLLMLLPGDSSGINSGLIHFLVEAFDTASRRWISLDAQFDAVPLVNGSPVNAAELAEALRNANARVKMAQTGSIEPELYLYYIKRFLCYIIVLEDQRIPWGSEQRSFKRLMLLPVGYPPVKTVKGIPFEGMEYTNRASLFYSEPD